MNSIETPEPLPPARINWVIFSIALLAPALISLLGAQIKSDGLAIGSVVFGSLIAGIVCGTLVGRRVGRTTGSRIGLGILFAAIFGALSFVLGFFGCALGGFQMDMR